MENIFEWLRYHKKLDFLLFVLFFIVIPTAPFIQSPIGILSKDDAVIFLSYYGTVIAGLAGGALTLFGVWWTIKDQNIKKQKDAEIHNKERKEELALIYKPTAILSLKDKYQDTPIDSILVNEDDYKDSNYSIVITLSNIGNGDMKNTYIDNFSYYLGKQCGKKGDQIFNRESIPNEDKPSTTMYMIPKGQYARFLLRLPSNILTNKSIPTELEIDLPIYYCPHVIKGTLIFHDVFSNKYSLEFCFYIQYVIDDSGSYLPYVYKNDMYHRSFIEKSL